MSLKNTLQAPVPPTRDLDGLARAAHACNICPWSKDATQTVFGHGAPKADIVFVGEQPGDQEDLQGRPFVGPAGKIFDRALGELGILREGLYVTNAVKHFKWTPRGKRRIHQKPAAGDIRACRPWLESEVEAIKPKVLVCLGTTAIHAVFGKATPLGALRGAWHNTALCERTLVTTHPSAILRAPDADAQQVAYGQFVDDLRALSPRGG